MWHIILWPRAALGHRPGKAVLRRTRHRGRHRRGVGHRFYTAQVRVGVSHGVSVCLTAIGRVIERHLIDIGFIAGDGQGLMADPKAEFL